jgi:hypothetical protein
MQTLSAKDQRTYDSVFRHPTSGNIEWTALIALIKHEGEVIDEPNGKLKFIRNGETLILKIHGKDADREAIEDVRRFFGKSEKTESHHPGVANFLLVLDHSEARIYRSESQDAIPILIEPFDPHGWDKHVHDTHVTARPYTTALHHEFYEKIADALSGAENILVFGDGNGSSSEFDRMLEDLKHRRPEIETHLLASINLDISHMTEAELLAKAREQFANTGPLLA